MQNWNLGLRVPDPVFFLVDRAGSSTFCSKYGNFTLTLFPALHFVGSLGRLCLCSWSSLGWVPWGSLPLFRYHFWHLAAACPQACSFLSPNLVSSFVRGRRQCWPQSHEGGGGLPAPVAGAVAPHLQGAGSCTRACLSARLLSWPNLPRSVVLNPLVVNYFQFKSHFVFPRKGN